jgi:hypothetical protein
MGLRPRSSAGIEETERKLAAMTPGEHLECAALVREVKPLLSEQARPVAEKTAWRFEQRAAGRIPRPYPSSDSALS